MKEEAREAREAQEAWKEREERVEAIEHARCEIQRTMQRLLQAEGRLRDAAIMIRTGVNINRTEVRGHVLGAQNVCLGLCLVMNGWLHRENSETAAAENEVPK